MIDWDRVAALREEIGPEDFDEVVELFLQEVDEEIEALSAQKQHDGLADKLHFLKGSAMSLGFREFSNLCQSGEVALSKNAAAAIDLPNLQTSYQTSRSTFLTGLQDRFAG
ncbi:Hpt domain-containing protein [Roseobacter weihaiensis]|uniref:Hpt domain-containing protein n=1 Tax=Roseobacter weihaiensis TaxID=2763262 RepID=UPI001D0BA667|nr:Hpt domain-containing protein [Roseobacter sp. H9]